MLIIFGKKLDDTKKIRNALTTIFGIGFSNANRICNFLNIPQNVKTFELTETQKTQISTYIKQHFIVEANLQKKVHENVQTMIEINCVKGFRHRTKLPVRGQRTHSNGKTCKKLS